MVLMVGRTALPMLVSAHPQILALLVIEVTITLMHHGMSLDTWKTPFNVLDQSGARTGTGTGARGLEGGVGSTEPKFTSPVSPAPATATSPATAATTAPAPSTAV
jgi:hypothetical protein